MLFTVRPLEKNFYFGLVAGWFSLRFLLIVADNILLPNQSTGGIWLSCMLANRVGEIVFGWFSSIFLWCGILFRSENVCNLHLLVWFSLFLLCCGQEKDNKFKGYCLVSLFRLYLSNSKQIGISQPPAEPNPPSQLVQRKNIVSNIEQNPKRKPPSNIKQHTSGRDSIASNSNNLVKVENSKPNPAAR